MKNTCKLMSQCKTSNSANQHIDNLKRTANTDTNATQIADIHTIHHYDAAATTNSSKLKKSRAKTPTQTQTDTHAPHASNVCDIKQDLHMHTNSCNRYIILCITTNATNIIKKIKKRSRIISSMSGLHMTNNTINMNQQL